MSGRLVFPDVPHERPAGEPWLRPALQLSNAVTYALVHASSRWARFDWEPSLASRLDPEHCQGRPVLLTCWHRFNYVVTAALLHLPDELKPSLLMHDGLGSRALTHHSSVWSGFETFVYRRRSPVSPRVQIIEYLRRTRRNLLLLPDAGGPYGRMKPGLVEVAAATKAWVLPLTVELDRAWLLGSTLRHAIPRPGARVRILAGELLDGTHLELETCQRMLDGAPAPAL